MRRARGYKYLLLQLLTDALAVSAGFVSAYALRFHGGIIPVRSAWEPSDYVWLFPLALGIWMLSLRMTHCYTNHPVVISFNKARRLLKGSLLAIALIVAFNYFVRTLKYSRVLYPITLVMVVMFLVVFRAVLQQAISAMIRGGVAGARVLIVGTGPLARRLAARCVIHPEYGYEVVGYVADSPERVGNAIEGVEVVGVATELRDLIQRFAIHEVFVTRSDMPPEEYLRLAMESEMEVAHIRIVPNMVELMTGDVYYDEIAGIPLFSLKETPLRGWNALAKRIVDVAGSAILLLILLPFWPVVAWLIRRDSAGPAFYRQRRVGLDGHEFEIVKFRTMRVDAEKDGPVWSGRIDERCTRVGRWLRAWDLDELPQLWNVLRGDMSLVGPRPERPEYVDQFKASYYGYMGRLRVRAGLTGWAQVHGLRGDTPIEQRLQYDLYYIENWSFWLDLKILIMTVLRRGVAPPAPPLSRTDTESKESSASPSSGKTSPRPL